MPIPSLLTANTSWLLTFNSTVAYPANDNWVAKVVFKNQYVSQAHTATPTNEPLAWTLGLTPEQTKVFGQGKTSAVFFVERPNERVVIETSSFMVAPDPFSPQVADQRSHVERTYDNVCGFLEGRKDCESYSINGRELKKIPIAELLNWRNYYARLLGQERNKAKGLATSIFTVQPFGFN